jgi:hypothetical protein
VADQVPVRLDRARVLLDSATPVREREMVLLREGGSMSDWKFLNLHRFKKPSDRALSMYWSEDSDGFNGLFRFVLDTRWVRCIASDGMDWQHVSVSIEESQHPPTWNMMCKVKDLFWEPEDWVCQFHPAHSEYVNHHPGCLHLWRPTAEKLPTPLSIMVGPKPGKIIA